jgi:hypothetical protein
MANLTDLTMPLIARHLNNHQSVLAADRRVLSMYAILPEACHCTYDLSQTELSIDSRCRVQHCLTPINDIRWLASTSHPRCSGWKCLQECTALHARLAPDLHQTQLPRQV